jgi:hypothetical protein
MNGVFGHLLDSGACNLLVALLVACRFRCTHMAVKPVLEVLPGVDCPRQGRHGNPELAIAKRADRCRRRVAEPFRYSKYRSVHKKNRREGLRRPESLTPAEE